MHEHSSLLLAQYEQIRKMLFLFACLNREGFAYAENQKQEKSVQKGRLEREKD